MYQNHMVCRDDYFFTFWNQTDRIAPISVLPYGEGSGDTCVFWQRTIPDSPSFHRQNDSKSPGNRLWLNFTSKIIWYVNHLPLWGFWQISTAVRWGFRLCKNNNVRFPLLPPPWGKTLIGAKNVCDARKIIFSSRV